MNHIFHEGNLEVLRTTSGALYIGAVMGLLGVIFALRRLMPVFFLAVFPATVAHELTHLGAALLLNGKPAGFRLIPQRSNNGYVLGTIRCANVRWYNGLFIGLAPLSLLAVAVVLLGWRAHGHVAINGSEALWAYAIACLAYAAIPSWQDIKVALASLWWLIALGAVVTWYHWIR
jgi:hypothetical protein